MTSRPTLRSHKPKALIIRAAGTNCDKETAAAFEAAGGETESVHVNQLLLGRVRLHPYQALIFPGGFSYGDDIAAGKVLANEMRLKLKDQLKKFVESKKLVIGVCNGFQVLVKTGLLPGFDVLDDEPSVTLTLNDSSRFQCEWVQLSSEKSQAEWLGEFPKTIELPVANAEGKFITASAATLKKLKDNNQIVFRYAPRNPNGSEEGIAGICNKAGNVIGLMPHPERFLTRYEHPNWTGPERARAQEWGDGFLFWRKAVDYARQSLN